MCVSECEETGIQVSECPSLLWTSDVSEGVRAMQEGKVEMLTIVKPCEELT